MYISKNFSIVKREKHPLFLMKIMIRRNTRSLKKNNWHKDVLKAIMPHFKKICVLNDLKLYSKKKRYDNNFFIFLHNLHKILDNLLLNFLYLGDISKIVVADVENLIFTGLTLNLISLITLHSHLN